MKSKLLAIAAVSLCTGCAVLSEHVDVTYNPDPGIARTAVQGAPVVRLQVTDARRAESQDWIADKQNGYGMRLASVLAQRPVADLVRDALAQELVARGVRVGDGPGSVTVEITRFAADYRNRFIAIGIVGTADLSVQVRRADGSIAYARNFSVSNDDENGLAGTAGMARRSVESALSKIVGQIVSDPAFLAALSAAPRTV